MLFNPQDRLCDIDFKTWYQVLGQSNLWHKPQEFDPLCSLRMMKRSIAQRYPRLVHIIPHLAIIYPFLNPTNGHSNGLADSNSFE
jgi:hypothetical protein